MYMEDMDVGDNDVATGVLDSVKYNIFVLK